MVVTKTVAGPLTPTALTSQLAVTTFLPGTSPVAALRVAIQYGYLPLADDAAQKVLQSVTTALQAADTKATGDTGGDTARTTVPHDEDDPNTAPTLAISSMDQAFSRWDLLATRDNDAEDVVEALGPLRTALSAATSKEARIGESQLLDVVDAADQCLQDVATMTVRGGPAVNAAHMAHWMYLVGSHVQRQLQAWWDTAHVFSAPFESVHPTLQAALHVTNSMSRSFSALSTYFSSVIDYWEPDAHQLALVDRLRDRCHEVLQIREVLQVSLLVLGSRASPVRFHSPPYLHSHSYFLPLITCTGDRHAYQERYPAKGGLGWIPGPGRDVSHGGGMVR